MKRLLPLLALATLLSCPALAQQDDSTNSAPSSPAEPGGGGHHHGGMLTKEEWQELKTAHEAAFQADPDLEAEGKDLQAKMEAYHEKLDQAMIKADPKVEPILAKMKAHRPHRGDFDGAPSTDGSQPGNP